MESIISNYNLGQEKTAQNERPGKIGATHDLHNSWKEAGTTKKKKNYRKQMQNIGLEYEKTTAHPTHLIKISRSGKDLGKGKYKRYADQRDINRQGYDK